MRTAPIGPLVYLNAWSLDGGAVLVIIRRCGSFGKVVALLGKVCPWE